MADNPTVPYVGAVAADDIGGTMYPRTKLVWGVDGSAVDASATNPLPTKVQPLLSRITVSLTEAQITSASTNYTEGDVIGVVMTLTDFASSAGGYGIIRNAILRDTYKLMGLCTLYLFDTTVTNQGADNAAFACTDAEMATCVGLIRFGGSFGSSAAGVNLPVSGSLNVPLKTNASANLFGVLVAETANAFFTAANGDGLSIVFDVERL